MPGRLDSRSPGEHQLWMQLRAAGLPMPEPNYRPCPQRRWRVDFAWLTDLLVVEVHGAVHRIKERHHADAEKELWLVTAGWRVLRVTPAQIKSGLALDAITLLLGRMDHSAWQERLRLHGVVKTAGGTG